MMTFMLLRNFFRSAGKDNCQLGYLVFSRVVTQQRLHLYISCLSGRGGRRRQITGASHTNLASLYPLARM